MPESSSIVTLIWLEQKKTFFLNSLSPFPLWEDNVSPSPHYLNSKFFFQSTLIWSSLIFQYPRLLALSPLFSVSSTISIGKGGQHINQSRTHWKKGRGSRLECLASIFCHFWLLLSPMLISKASEPPAPASFIKLDSPPL